MSLLRIVYFSENRIGVSRRHARIGELLSTAITRNRQNQVTGALLRDDLWFVQVLEGSPAAVQATFDRIVPDPRHHNVKIISKTMVNKRLFGEWSMGLAMRSPQTEHLFGAHWYNKGMNPGTMSERNALELMVALNRQGMLISGLPAKAKAA